MDNEAAHGTKASWKDFVIWGIGAALSTMIWRTYDVVQQTQVRVAQLTVQQKSIEDVVREHKEATTKRIEDMELRLRVAERDNVRTQQPTQ